MLRPATDERGGGEPLAARAVAAVAGAEFEAASAADVSAEEAGFVRTFVRGSQHSGQHATSNAI